MSIVSSCLSEAGPRVVNEDAVESWRGNSGAFFLAIADGLGGMGNGDVASRLALNTVRDQFYSTLPSETSLRSALEAAHSRILEAQREDSARGRMATTFTVIAILGLKVFGAHCGDTRAAVARGNGIKRLTRDHSEGQRLFDAGKLTKEELATYQRQHILESALGDQEAPSIDTFEFQAAIGDRFVLTSDGVHGVVFLRELRELLVASDQPDHFVRSVKELVMERGPKDNFTVAAAFVIE